MASALRSIPSVDRIVREVGEVRVPRAVVVAVARREVVAIRKGKGAVDGQAVIERVRRAVVELREGKIRPLINGTGIIIHTNFGRAPLGDDAMAAVARIGGSYNNLEYDLAGGKRGGRGAYVEHNLAVLCGAQAATIANNCAAALVLMVRHFVTRRPERNEVVISRGELVQIGGGFRVPEILAATGAVLREVGTTNKTTLADYRRAIGKRTAMVLKVHRSNFFMDGFVASPTTSEIAGVAKAGKVVFVQDVGSGAASPVSFAIDDSPSPGTPGEGRGEGSERWAGPDDAPVDGKSPHPSPPPEYQGRGQKDARTFADLSGWGAAPHQHDRLHSAADGGGGVNEHEPSPRQAIAQGADLVCFSGDKLLGGPQAGVIAGRGNLVAALKNEPMFRALRCDKLILAALQETVDLHLNREIQRIPALAMMSAGNAALLARAGKLLAALEDLPVAVAIGRGKAQVGGGALPRAVIPSVTLDLRPRALTVQELSRRLRSGEPAVVGYIAGGAFKLDLRTIFVREDELLAAAVRALTASGGS